MRAKALNKWNPPEGNGTLIIQYVGTKWIYKKSDREWEDFYLGMYIWTIEIQTSDEQKWMCQAVLYCDKHSTTLIHYEVIELADTVEIWLVETTREISRGSFDEFLKFNSHLKVVAVQSIESQSMDYVTIRHICEHIARVKVAMMRYNINYP